MTMTEQGGAFGASPGKPRDETPLKDLAGAAVQTVKAETATFAAAAQDKVSEKVTVGTAAAAQTMGDFASAIRKAGDDLAEHDQSMAARMVKQAADGLESLTRSVADKRPEEMLETVRDFGRRNPVAFIAGSVLLGVAIGRLAKSTEQRGASSEPRFRQPGDYLPQEPVAMPADPSVGEDRTIASPPPYGVGYGSGT